MPESPSTSCLEKFRDPRLPFVYWVDDAVVSAQVLKDVIFSGSYGLEVGFGRQPTKLFLVDNRIPWILTEHDKDQFETAKRDLWDYWKMESVPPFPPEFKMIALLANSTYSAVAEAQVLVYRNMDYWHMYIPRFEDLKIGQRLYYIVDESHAGEELVSYRRFLSKNGYDYSRLELRPPELPTLSMAYQGNKHTYVLDLVK